VETDDAILLLAVHDVCPRRPRGCCRRRVLLEPDVQRLDAAVEVREVVISVERLGIPEPRQLLGPRTTDQASDSRLDLRGSIERRRERLPRLAVEHELSSVGEDRLGTLATTFDEKLRHGLANRGRGLPKELIVGR
jgi:hypothetical protein